MEFAKQKVSSKIQLVKKQCAGKSVLDVGCVGQDNDFSSPNWVHRHLVAVASNVTGVDINRAGIQQASTLGFHIVHVDELDVSQKFDVITMLDVIEHVNDICQFINYYAPYMKEDGKMIITTPNPFNIRQSFNILLFSKPSINPEHTSFIDPFNFVEIANRVDMKIQDFNWLKEYDKPVKLYLKLLTTFVFSWLRVLRRHLNANYAVILTK
ncbi:MAG: class I SAM-dependent methyltransferase [Saprospiraceae bacterium]|nr:class I SAM-dependent methyltransferase [Saprospiraceae bacterium]